MILDQQSPEQDVGVVFCRSSATDPA